MWSISSRCGAFHSDFFGERGGESIHHEFVDLARSFSHVHPDSEQLKRMLEEHYVIVHQQNREVIPQKEKRNLKRRREEPSV